MNEPRNQSEQKRAGSAVAAVLIACLAGPAFAQVEDVLEAGVNDVGSLSASLRVARPDLRMASDFDRVYRVPDGSGMMMRRDGALTAVFPESEYVPTRQGLIPIVPAGTTWVIGEASSGCTKPSGPVCVPLPAQQPFFMPGPTGASPRPAKKPLPPGAVSPAPKPLALRIGEAVGTPGHRRIELPLCAEPASAPAAAADVPTTGTSPLPRSMDISDEFYRRMRLREIARRYGPRD